MKKLFILFTACLFTLFCVAQNLVPNPSFEEMYSCPDNTSMVDSCLKWNAVSKTPDYFVACSSYPVSIPDNFVGSQLPFDGNAYMGIVTYDWYFYWREIIGTQLLDSLVSGNKYHVSMRVSRGNWTEQAYNCAASNKLGMRFTMDPYSILDTPIINNYAHVFTDSIISDTLNWVLLEWDFIADSAYKYVYIGNFFDDEHTDTAVINAPLGEFGIAYYYIDSVSIICVDDRCATTILEERMDEYLISFIPTEKKLQISPSPNGRTSLLIFNSSGQQITTIESPSSQVNLSNLSTGIYIVQLVTPKDNFIRKIFIY